MDAFIVLSIEDNMANSALLARLFRTGPGTILHSANSAHAGIDLACRCQPDLILLDLHLPDLSGEEVFARLRAEPATATIPIVVLSADATPGTVRRLLARGRHRLSDQAAGPARVAGRAGLGRRAASRDQGQPVVTHTVLYVEDNDNNIRLVERLLRRRPHIALVIAVNGTEGLRTARDALPTLILLDRRLPDMLGSEVLRQLKTSTATAAIPVVVISGDSGGAEAAEILRLGAEQFLAKPYDLHEFLAMVDRFCG